MSATRGTAPAFQVYAFDLMAKRDYSLMTLAERGLLFSMWCECWANIELPSNPIELAVMLGKPDEVKCALTSKVVSFFKETNNKTFLSPDLESYREQVLHQRDLMSKGGSKGGKKRVENERMAREASSQPSKLPSKSNQATLKGREPESESESENQSLGSDKSPSNVEWLNDYEKASRGG